MVRLLLSAVFLVATVFTASAQDRYRIQPGDVLQIEVLEDTALNRNTLVLPDGTISFPLAGTVQAGGRTVGSIQTALVNALTPSFATAPNVTVTVNSLANVGGKPAPKTIDVFVMGEVANPGKLTINRGTTLLQFLAESGGFTRFAATKRIQLRRTSGGKSMIYKFNYKAIENGTAAVNSLVLHEGDVIVVPERRLFE